MASNLYNTASVLVPKGAAGRASVIDAYRPAFNVLQSIGITRNDANGSFRNQQGLIEFAAANVPRFNWDEGDSCPKLLVEPSRENLLTYSEQFDNAAWTKSRSTATANQIASPDGTTTADLLEDDLTASASHRVFNNTAFSLVTGTDYTCSIFLKKGSTAFGELAILESGEGASGIDSILFDLENGYLSGAGTGTITNYGNDWYRITVSGTSTVTTAGRVFLYIYDSSGNKTYNGTASNNFYAWGAQLEEGSYATSYIKTEATTQTRNADVISQTGLASLIGDSEGTLYVEAETFDATNDFISLSDGTNSNRCSLDINGSSFRFEVLVGGATQASISGGSYTSGVIYKAACSYAVNSFAFYVDGTQIGTDVSGSTFADATLTNIELNTGNGSGAPFYGKISVLAWWQARLSNSVLESLTSYETYEEMAATLDYTID